MVSGLPRFRMALAPLFVLIGAGFGTSEFRLGDSHGVPARDSRGSPTGLPRSLENRELAFIRSAGRHQEHIYVARPDGSKMRRLKDGKGCKQRPVWSPDGRRIAYRFEPNCDYNLDQVVVIDVRTSARLNISRKTGIFGNSPSWSPDGGRLAFAGLPSVRGRPARGSLSLYIARSNGSTAKRVTPRSLGEVQYPFWSPNGAWIAFQISRSSTGSGFDLYRIDPDGSNLKRLTQDGAEGAYNEWPMWSPDSKQIAYGVEGEQSALWVMRADGSSKHKIRSGIGVPASWAPGAWLVANCRLSGGRPGVCAVPPTGSRLIPLLHGIDGGFPAWRP
jgi:Tol biopolymer transport system component